MTQDESWDRHWHEIMDYITRYRRLPSKHRVEDHRMLNWLKYNRKKIAKQKLDGTRLERFQMLMEKASQFQRVNQYAYKTTQTAQSTEGVLSFTAS